MRMLMDKEGNEAKAKRACQQKEWQKLIFDLLLLRRSLGRLQRSGQREVGTMWVCDHLTSGRHSKSERRPLAR